MIRSIITFFNIGKGAFTDKRPNLCSDTLKTEDKKEWIFLKKKIYEFYGNFYIPFFFR